MKPAVVLLGLVLLLDATFAADESCAGRCGTFDSLRKCQCDSMCVYYGSCCADYDSTCPKKIARGDTFAEAEEEVTTAATVLAPNTPTLMPTYNTVPATAAAPTAPPTTQSSTTPADPNTAPCSGRPFDAFLQLKNSSIYAFRGEYFFELDEKSVLPGYPKRIQDVWGIPGPIDAAFTRINCQGKTYIFKGNQYWRFEGDVLDAEYPRDISLGFEGIPNGVDAAFAIPAPSHRGREKAYFFKGNSYYQYNFKNQPNHEECFRMSSSSPSVLFTRYTDLFCDRTWEDFFTDLFGEDYDSHRRGPRLTSRDWIGIRPPVDAAIVGRVYLSPKPTSPPPVKKRRGRKRKPSRKSGKRRTRSRRGFFDDFWSYDDWYDSDYYMDLGEETPDPEPEPEPEPEPRRTPAQNVYFFKRDKYYRVDLQTKRVDSVLPPYPRSIAKYWLGCKHEEKPDASRAEKK